MSNILYFIQRLGNTIVYYYDYLWGLGSDWYASLSPKNQMGVSLIGICVFDVYLVLVIYSLYLICG